MLRRRLFIVVAVVMLASMLSVSFVQVAGAQPPPGIDPVEFTMTPEQCPVLQSTLNGVGEYNNIVNVRQTRLGISVYTVDSTATGTATDTAGGMYTFYYRNVGTAIVIPGLGEFVRFTDHFELQGTGTAAGMTLDFEAAITPWSFTTFNESGAPPECDPI
jgi:hypothetical protein